MQAAAETVEQATKDLLRKKQDYQKLKYLRDYYSRLYDPYRFLIILDSNEGEMKLWHRVEKYVNRRLFPREIADVINHKRDNRKLTPFVFRNCDGKSLAYQIQQKIWRINFEVDYILGLSDEENIQLIDRYLDEHSDDIDLVNTEERKNLNAKVPKKKSRVVGQVE